MTRTEEAKALFAQGFSCSQAVVGAFAPTLGLDRDTALKIASGFGGGMGRLAETCGAVTGAFIVLGLKCGSPTPDREAKEAVYARVREFAARFQAIHGSLLCRELLGCNLNTAEGLALAQEKKLFSTVCPPYVVSVAEPWQQPWGRLPTCLIPGRLAIRPTTWPVLIAFRNRNYVETAAEILEEML